MSVYTNINLADSVAFQQATDLSARFHKVMISTKMPSMTKTVKGLVQDIERKNGATVGAALKETGPKLYADNAHWTAVKQARNKVVTAHQKLTSVWDQSGWRLLSTAQWDEYHQTIQPLITAFYSAVDLLVAEFDNMVLESRTRLGDLFERNDYPETADGFKTCFMVNTHNEPVPKLEDAQRLRTVLPLAEIESMQKDMQRAFNDNIERINTQNWEMLYTHTAKLANSLTAWSKGEQRSIKKTLLAQIEEACHYCTRFNVSNDPKMAAMIEDVRNKLLSVDMDEIREKPEVCKQVVQSATSARDTALAAMSKMGGFGCRVN